MVSTSGDHISSHCWLSVENYSVLADVRKPLPSKLNERNENQILSYQGVFGMKRRHKRIGFILVGLAGLGIASYFVASAFRQNLVFFFSPTQVAAKEAPVNRTFRVGGLVEKGTLKRDPDGLTVRFTVTDTAASIP